jgi:hypothetical protein
MDTKEQNSMKKHRGLLLGLGLMALIGLSAREARAGNLTMVISWGTHTLTIDQTSPLANADSTANFLDINTGAVNAQLLAGGSALTLSGLTALSNNPGEPNPVGGTLSEQGTAALTGTGTTSITIATFQTAFTIPPGPSGTLSSSSTANYTNATPGNSTVANSSYNTTILTPSLTYTYTGATNPQAFASNNSINVAATTASYQLDNSATINLTAGTNRFSVAARFNAIPEPAGLIMMVTGMSLPLVLGMGLLRRRRAAA